MFRIANLQIDPLAVEHMPESVAREECVLPISVEGNVLRVVFGRRLDYRQSIETLRFILDMRVECAVADRTRVENAIDEVYKYFATEISNCPLEFRLECPKRWLELQPTEHNDIRFCETCQRDVHLCNDDNDAMKHAQLGHCVAICREPECVDTVGILEFPDAE